MKKIPEFKPSNHFLGDTDLPCLVAKVKNSKLPGGIASRHLQEFKEDEVCNIYLRGKEPEKISKWQQKILEQLFLEDGLAAAIEEGMKEYEKMDDAYSDFSKPERAHFEKHGIAPFLTLLTIVIDETNREVILSAHTIYDGNLDEHGITIFLKNNRWRFDDGDYFIRYQSPFLEAQEQKNQQGFEKAWEAVFPPPDPGVLVTGDASILFGVWRYNPDETAKVRKQLGMSAREIKEAHSSGASLGLYFSSTTSEHLSNGENICLRTAQYEQKGNWITVKFPENQASALGKAEEFWCDGKRLIYAFGKDVYTRVKDSYRKPARVVSVNNELADLLKQIRKDKLH